MTIAPDTAETEAPEAEEDAPEVEAPDTEATPTAKDLADAQAEIEKWKALARQHETRSKANAEAAQKIQEMEDAQKSEAERQQDRIDKAEARADTAEAENVRLRVAIRHGMTLEQTARLVGDTEEELDADAVEFLKMIAPPAPEAEDDEPPATNGGRPKPRLKSGAKSYGIGDDDALLRDLKRKVGVK